MTAKEPMTGTRGSARIVGRRKRSSASGTRRSTDAKWRGCTSSRRENRGSTSKNSEIRGRSRMPSARHRKSMGNASRMRLRVSRCIARSL